MGFMERLKSIFGGAERKETRERAPDDAVADRVPNAPEGPQSHRAPEPSTGFAQKGTAATGVGTGDPVPGAVEETDPAIQSASAEETPEEQREAAAQDPAATSEPGTEGQDQEPR